MMHLHIDTEHILKHIEVGMCCVCVCVSVCV